MPGICKSIKDIAENCLGVKLNGRSLEFMNEFLPSW